MNPNESLLALIADLYSQVRALQAELARLQAEGADKPKAEAE